MNRGDWLFYCFEKEEVQCFKKKHFQECALPFFLGKGRTTWGLFKNADHPGNGARYAFSNAVKNI